MSLLNPSTRRVWHRGASAIPGAIGIVFAVLKRNGHPAGFSLDN